jgi:type I restriction enzyme M protein
MSDSRIRGDILKGVQSAYKDLQTGNAASDGKAQVLGLLFLRFLSDHRKSRLAEARREYADDDERVARAMSREWFTLADHCTFDALFDQRGGSHIDQLINAILEQVEKSNHEILSNVLKTIDFESDTDLGPSHPRIARLKALIEALHSDELDLSPERISKADFASVFAELVVRLTPHGINRKAMGLYQNPVDVDELIIRLAAPQTGDSVYDPTAGHGALLIRAALAADPSTVKLFGQESDCHTWALGKLNLLLHNLTDTRFEKGDSIREPLLLESDALMHFDIAIAAPPFGLRSWRQELAAEDRYGRFRHGIPPKNHGVWALICHMIATADDGRGRVVVEVPHGALFRSGPEARIREAVISENILAGVISLPGSLPGSLHHGGDSPAALLIFDKSRLSRHQDPVFLIDAGRTNKQNEQPCQTVDSIAETFHSRNVIAGYSGFITFDAMRTTGFSLNFSRYLDIDRCGPESDTGGMLEKIRQIQNKLEETQRTLAELMKNAEL